MSTFSRSPWEPPEASSRQSDYRLLPHHGHLQGSNRRSYNRSSVSDERPIDKSAPRNRKGFTRETTAEVGGRSSSAHNRYYRADSRRDVRKSYSKPSYRHYNDECSRRYNSRRDDTHSSRRRGFDVKHRRYRSRDHSPKPKFYSRRPSPRADYRTRERSSVGSRHKRKVSPSSGSGSSKSRGSRGDKYSRRKHKTSQRETSKERRRKDDLIVHFEWHKGMWLNRRYRVTGLLGEGTFGRVLRCQDDETKEEVAVKVVRAVKRYTSSAKVEADTLKLIGDMDRHNNSKCVRLLDRFLCKGKNMCLVFERLGLSLYELLTRNSYNGFFLEDIQQFAKRCLQALSFMHAIKLTHTDLKLENILLEVNDFETVPFKRRCCLQTSSRSREPCYIERPRDPRVKIIDFGSATFEDEYHSTMINTRQYRAPEVILDIGWDMSSDVWSLGCILMELYTGSLVFETHEHLEHLAMIERIKGRIPTRMFEQACRTDGRRYIRPKSLTLDWPGDETTSASIKRVEECRPFRDVVLPRHFLLADFVDYLLEIDPKLRPTPNAALLHPFFDHRFDE